jgi:hypothetical protein
MQHQRKPGVRMRKSRSNLVVFVLLGLCVLLAVPTEDVPDTTCDESASLPYEDAAPFSTPSPQQSLARIVETDLDRGSYFHSTSVMKRCQLYRECKARSERIRDSVTVLHGSLRC